MDTSSLADDRPDSPSPADHPPFDGLSVMGFTPYYNVWRCSGLWWQPGDWRLVKGVAMLIRFFIVVMFILLMFVQLLSAKSLDNVMELLLPLTTFILINLKSWLIVRERKSVMELFSIAKQLEASSVGKPEEVAIFVKANRYAGKLLRLVLSLCLCNITFHFVQIVKIDVRKLLWKSAMPFDWEHASSNLPHIFALGFQLISNYYHGVLYSTLNPFAPYLYIMLVGNLDILAKRLSALGHRGERKEVFEREFIKCVQYHKLCLRYHKCLHEIFSLALLVQFVFNGFVICLTAFQLSVVLPSETSRFTFLIMYLLNMTFELFIPCYFASRLSAYSDRLSNALYDCNWNGQPLRFQAAIIMFITGLQRRIEVNTVKKLVVVELPTFVTVCRAAYSLLSCLKGL